MVFYFIFYFMNVLIFYFHTMRGMDLCVLLMSLQDTFTC